MRPRASTLRGWAAQPRHVVRVALLLAVTLAGSVLAHGLAERDARRDSDRAAEVAAVQIRGRVVQAASLAESLRQFMLDRSGTGVTSDQFTRNALRWLSPARFSAAAWVEPIPNARRAAYERRIGQSIVTPDSGVVPRDSRSSYLPATLVSGFPPLAVPGVDLSATPGMAAALARARRIDGVSATPMAASSDGTRGLFLVAPAPNLVGQVLRPGYVALFVSDLGLRAAATDLPAVRVTSADAAPGAGAGGGSGNTIRRSFTAAGQRFDVAVPREPVEGPGAVLPWVILAGGLVVAALGGALGFNAARRNRAQEELDRIFTLSRDVIAVADFEGRFTRVNPAAEEILGYTEEELLTRPYVDLVHPGDREKTAEESDAIASGRPTVSFENRYVRKDGSIKMLEWTTTPDVDKRLMYSVARDVTERRAAEAEARRLADEQAALRRVATLVARDASQTELFTVIAEECAQLLGTDDIAVIRYAGGRDMVMLATSGDLKAIFPAGSRQPLGGDSVATSVFRTGRAARMDDYGHARGRIPDAVRPIGLRCAVATPIVVESRLWGSMVAATSAEELLPPETEARLAQFTALMATAIANAESRGRADRLNEGQAALRRVATLVAKEAPPAEVFASVAEELSHILGDVDCSLFRDEGDGTASAVAVSGAVVSAAIPVGTRMSIDGPGVIASVLRDGHQCRIGDYSAIDGDGAIAQRARELGLSSAVGCPVVVGDRIWGALGAASREAEAFPPESEARIAQFADLVATAIANAAARAEVERLAEEQAALRRVAVLVADGAAPAAVFDAVAAEMEGLLGADGATLSRYEPDGEVTIVAHRGMNAALLPPGTRTAHESRGVISVVRNSERPARMESRGGTDGEMSHLMRSLGVRACVAAPIVVDGRLWGVAIANWAGDETPPPDSEDRMAQFAGLLDTAIANADSRDQLTASRARLLTASDDARRRVVRDLHDGAQQRLVHTIITLKLAQRSFRLDDGRAEALIAEALEHAQNGNAELRELVHGILPATLTSGGLQASLGALVSRLGLPVGVDVPAQRFPAELEANAYFIVAEALTNVVKHSHATRADVRAHVDGDVLRLEVRDDGVGGADPNGHGLVGIGDRATALGGQFSVRSPVGGGTFVTAALPLRRRADRGTRMAKSLHPDDDGRERG
ncbi:MAG TPA: GAF domain-containing protein [Baekduia sp.]